MEYTLPRAAGMFLLANALLLGCFVLKALALRVKSKFQWPKMEQAEQPLRQFTWRKTRTGFSGGLGRLVWQIVSLVVTTAAVLVVLTFGNEFMLSCWVWITSPMQSATNFVITLPVVFWEVLAWFVGTWFLHQLLVMAARACSGRPA